MDFYHLLKTLVHMQLKLLKIRAISIVENVLTVLKKKKIVSKRTIRKTAEATGDLIGNKIADKITRILKSQQNDEANNEILTKRKVYISRKKAQLFDELRLVE